MSKRTVILTCVIVTILAFVSFFVFLQLANPHRQALDGIQAGMTRHEVQAVMGGTPHFTATHLGQPGDRVMKAEESWRVEGGLLQKQPDRRRGMEDLLWALLNTREFMFNH